MAVSTNTPSHIEITETLLRLYVFLSQYLDRCLDETIRKSFPEADLQAHLADTRKQIIEMLSVNRVVKGKVEQECEHVLSLGAACLTGKGGSPPSQNGIEAVKAERAILKNKTIALSDLLAVFRAHD
jgi:hypothetical protein